MKKPYSLTLLTMKAGLISCLVIYASCTVRAQNESIKPQHVNIASPNAASLGKVADIPIGYHTGIPNVDIPIHEFTAGPLKLPIGLSYHSGGLRVNEQASWVGAGWSLNAGGMITRTVKSLPDEIVGGSSNSYIGNQGFQSYLFTNDGSFNPTALQSPYPAVILDYYQFASGLKDSEPDLFTFNFNGYTGKFYFRADSTVALAPLQDLRVTPILCSNCSTNLDYLQGWVVVTPDGVKYYFGKTPAGGDVDPLEYTNTYSAGSGITYAKTYASWFLNKIESADSKYVINLTYTSENYSFYTTSFFPLASGQEGGSNGYDLVKNFVIGVRLSSLSATYMGTGVGQTVTFTPSNDARLDLSSSTSGLNDVDFTPASDNAKSLWKIDISNNGTFCKTFEFGYDYFYDNSHSLNGPWNSWQSTFNIHCDKRKLKLNSVTERSCDGSASKPPHVFTYFDESSVPRTLSLAQDHWGFFNGATGNSTLMPPISFNNGWTTAIGSASRDSSWPAMRAGGLEKIQYPTGGYTRFVFNNHKVFVDRNNYDSVLVSHRSSTNYYASPSDAFSISTTKTFKLIKGYPNGNIGEGSYIIKDAATNQIVNPTVLGTAGTHVGGVPYIVTICQLPAGSYYGYVQSNYNDSYHPTEAFLYRFDFTWTTMVETKVGGLRIDSLIYNDGQGHNTSIQTFEYVNANGQNMGVLFSRPQYIALAYNQQIKEQGGIPHSTDAFDPGYDGNLYLYQNGCVTYDATYKSYYYSGSPFLPMRTSQGNHFGYNEVMVRQADGGYTIYKFTFAANPTGDVCIRVLDLSQCDPNAPTYPPAPLPFDFGRGELINKSSYKYVNGTNDVLINEKKYTTEYTYEQAGTAGIAIAKHGQMGMGTPYQLKSAKKTKVTEEDKTYNADGTGSPVYTKTETFFESQFHMAPTRVVVTDMNSGKVLSESRSTYTKDLTIPSCTNANTFDASLGSNLASRWATYQSAVSGCPDNKCKYRKWLEYRYDVNELWKANTTSRINFNVNLKTCMNSTAVWNAAGTDLKALIKMNNGNQLTVIENSRWRAGQFLGSAFVTYQDFGGNYYPGKFEALKTSTPLSSSSFAPVTSSASTITKDNKYSLEETYSYSNGNLVQVTPKNGLLSSYIWNPTQLYPVAEIKNAASGTSAFTSFEETANEGGWSYTFTNYSDSKTGSRSHILNGNSVTASELNSTSTYTLSYWAKGGIPNINGGVQSSNDALSAEPDGWRYFEKTISGVTTFSISSGPDVYLDELRIYPKGALMTTYTYKPLVGIISSTDPNNRSGYFDYDPLGRLWLMRDPNRNILKQYKYNYRVGPTAQ